jgi:hypothetical protein
VDGGRGGGAEEELEVGDCGVCEKEVVGADE